MRKHLVAVALLLLTGLAVSLSLAPGLAQADAQVWLRWIGLRFFGYGALVMLGAALAIGPVARLQPRRLSRLLPYRRAVGIWSTVAAGLHLLFALTMASSNLRLPNWPALFVQIFRGYHANGTLILQYGLPTTALSMVAWTGLLAFLLLLLVALVSNDFAQKRLGQATWKLIQQWSYTAFLFVALHIGIMTTAGGKLKGSPQLMGWAIWFVLGVATLQAAGFVYTVAKRRP